MKVVIFGGYGQLGSALKDVLKENCIQISKEECDITSQKKVEEIISKYKPDVVINCAAMTHVDKCEEQKEKCYQINYLGNKYIIDNCKKNNIYCIYISTYYVFKGTKEGYVEDDYLSPLNYYAFTKTIADVYTQCYQNALSVRVSKLISKSNSDTNFLARLLQTLKQNEKISLPDFEYNNIITVKACAHIISELIRIKETGVIHVGGKENISMYQLGKKISSYFNLDSDLILKKEKSDNAVKRPTHVYLKTDRLQSLGINTYSIDEMLQNE